MPVLLELVTWKLLFLLMDAMFRIMFNRKEMPVSKLISNQPIPIYMYDLIRILFKFLTLFCFCRI